MITMSEEEFDEIREVLRATVGLKTEDEIVDLMRAQDACAELIERIWWRNQTTSEPGS